MNEISLSIEPKTTTALTDPGRFINREQFTGPGRFTDLEGATRFERFTDPGRFTNRERFISPFARGTFFLFRPIDRPSQASSLRPLASG